MTIVHFLNGPIKRQSSHQWERVSRIQVTVQKTWSRWSHMKHACVVVVVFLRCPAHPLKLSCEDVLCKKATWLFLHYSVVRRDCNWPLGLLCPCEDCQKVLFFPPTGSSYSRHEDSWSLVQLHAPEDFFFTPPRLGPTTDKHDGSRVHREDGSAPWMRFKRSP